MIDLPDFSPLRITQHPDRPGRKRFDVLDHVIAVLPRRPNQKLLSRLPKSTQVKRLLRGGQHDELRTLHLDNKRATAMTLARYDSTDAFKSLTWARKLVQHCLEHKPAKLGVLPVGLDPADRDEAVLAIAAAAQAASFELPNFKSKNARKNALATLQLLAADPRWKLSSVEAESVGNNIARWFTAMPPNVLTAKAYRECVEKLAGEYGMQSEFIDERKLEKLGAGAFLAVSQGNATRDAGILRLRYRPSGTKRPELALVGKGILFDTGGTNLKPFKSMLDMHIDMQGSAVALGTAAALAIQQVPFAFDVWLAISENRLSATAYKSQDVVTAVNGKTIQVIHTDAEGRMVLADTLSLAAREAPKLVIDYATLTGACITALTTRYSGVFSNRPDTAGLLVRNGAASGERVWSFPMAEDYDEALKSQTADIKQCAADGSGDHILAARFLNQFVPSDVAWIHMDLSAGQHKGGLAHVPSEITGFGVRYTLALLQTAADGPAGIAAAIGA